MPDELPDTINDWLRTVKKVRCFRDKIKVYAPTCYGQCVPAVDKLISDLNRIFKGSTVYDARGSWLDDNGRLETEPVKVIEIAHKCTTAESARAFAKAIGEYGTKASQTALSINDDNQFYIARSPQLVKAFVKEMKRSRS